MPPLRGANSTRAACLLRPDKDLQEAADKLPFVTLEFPDTTNLQHFNAPISPIEGQWTGGTFLLDFQIPDGWPIDRPRVTIKTRVWYPNI
jgi:ubiquitin-protein ligase